VRKLASVPHERRLSRSEIERLAKTLRAIAEEGEHPWGLRTSAINLLLEQTRVQVFDAPKPTNVYLPMFIDV
jgi:hypothetical protein